MRRVLVAWSLVILCTPVMARGQVGFFRRAQTTESSAVKRPVADESESVDPASPRAAVRAYLRAARKGDWAAAAK